ncbi:MAG: universal stress protein [Candidatus Obscuribacterales bacterium]|nr:universal stress protein [Candidatus Obscuribacterales bacterium]
MKILIAIDELKFVPTIAEYVISHFVNAPTVKVVHVIEPAMIGSYMSVLPPPLLDEISKEAWDAGKRLVRTLALKLRDHFHNPDIEELVVTGFIVAEIVQTAKDFQPDLIILGSHGKHGFKRLAMGSVSARVAAQAPCSVLIVQPEVRLSQADEIHKLIVAGLKKDE